MIGGPSPGDPRDPRAPRSPRSGTLFHAPAPLFGRARRSAPARACSLRPGDLVAGPRLVVAKPLGRGGMGEVYEAEHPELGRRFAIKVLHRELHDRPDLAARIIEEARILGRIQHPNVVQVFDLGATADGRPYFVMELLPGRDLRAEIQRRGALPPVEALSLVEQALAGLGAAHAAGVVHRDVKLENLALADDGALKVIDFGVARLARRAGAFRTAADAVVGTPRSMAPEQCSPGGEVDARADLYAMGLVLYELLTGRGPFDELRGHIDAIRFAHCDRPPPPPSRFAKRPVPPEVERVILRALEKDPARRFQSAAEMAAALRRARAALWGCDSEATTLIEGTPTWVGWAPEATPTRIEALFGATPDPSPPTPAAPVPARGLARTGRAAPRAPLLLVRRARRAALAARRRPTVNVSALGLCAVMIASLALLVSLGGRDPAPDPPVDGKARAAVR